MKRRKIWLTVMASIFFPGLGHLYNGKVLKGIIFSLSLYIGNRLFYYLFLQSFPIAIISFALFIIIFIFGIVDSYRIAKKNRNYSLKRMNKWYWYLSFVLLVSLLNILYSSLFEKFERYSIESIASSGMSPAFEIRDRVVIDNYYYSYNDIERNDLIVFHSSDDDRLTLKRLVALEGDTVEIRNYQLYVNGEINNSIEISTFDEELNSIMEELLKPLYLQLEEDPTNTELLEYIEYRELLFHSYENYGPYIVPVDSVFVLGDNRYNSIDSRSYDAINISQIQGRLIYKFYPEVVRY